jgi:ATPase subunit of ABC transporter with duplicated ATPase domains
MLLPSDQSVKTEEYTFNKDVTVLVIGQNNSGKKSLMHVYYKKQKGKIDFIFHLKIFILFK